MKLYQNSTLVYRGEKFFLIWFWLKKYCQMWREKLKLIMYNESLQTKPLCSLISCKLQKSSTTELPCFLFQNISFRHKIANLKIEMILGPKKRGFMTRSWLLFSRKKNPLVLEKYKVLIIINYPLGCSQRWQFCHEKNRYFSYKKMAMLPKKTSVYK